MMNKCAVDKQIILGVGGNVDEAFVGQFLKSKAFSELNPIIQEKTLAVGVIPDPARVRKNIIAGHDHDQPPRAHIL